MQEHKRVVEKDAPLKKDDLIVITGAGGFIAGNLALYFKKKGFTNIRAVDKKPDPPPAGCSHWPWRCSNAVERP